MQSIGAEPARDRLVSYLPLANMAAQMFDLWMPMAAIATVHFGRPDPFEKVVSRARVRVCLSV